MAILTITYYCTMLTWNKFIYPAGFCKIAQAPCQVPLNSGCRVVAVVRIFGHEFLHDVRQGFGNPGVNFVQRLRINRDMAVDEFHRILGLEGEPAGQNLIKGDSQRVQITAVVGRPVHPAGLLRGNIGQGALRHILVAPGWSL